MSGILEKGEDKTGVESTLGWEGVWLLLCKLLKQVGIIFEIGVDWWNLQTCWGLVGVGIWTKNEELECSSEGDSEEDKLEDETKGKNLY